MIESYEGEIKDLRAQIENNPLLSEKHARVLHLEEKLRSSNKDGAPSETCLSQILEHVNLVLKVIEEHKTNLAFLECELQQKSFAVQDEGKMDIDEEVTFQVSQTSRILTQSKFSKTSNISILHTQNEEEVQDLRN